jgi:hypothetical protein
VIGWRKTPGDPAQIVASSAASAQNPAQNRSGMIFPPSRATRSWERKLMLRDR